MDNQIESKKVVYPAGDLPRVWNDTIPIPNIEGKYAYGSRLFSKMIEFLQTVLLTKEDYEFYKNLGPARTDNEEYDTYKIRQKFQKALTKYKFTIKQSIFINTVEMLQAKAKEQQENGTNTAE